MLYLIGSLLRERGALAGTAVGYLALIACSRMNRLVISRVYSHEWNSADNVHRQHNKLDASLTRDMFWNLDQDVYVGDVDGLLLRLETFTEDGLI